MGQDLLVYIAGDAIDSGVEALRVLVERPATEETGSREPPVFVDEVDDSSCTTLAQRGNHPVRTTGVLFEVSSPGEEPETPASELARVVEALAALSKREQIELELLLDNDGVGSIRNGIVDRTILEGLLVPWSRHR